MLIKVLMLIAVQLIDLGEVPLLMMVEGYLRVALKLLINQ
jgi:hypothetical protein